MKKRIPRTRKTASRAKTAKLETALNRIGKATPIGKASKNVKTEGAKSKKTVACILFVLVTFLFTYGPEVNNRIPTWQDIYSLAGLGKENANVDFPDFEEMPLTAFFIDVGQGDCTFIHAGETDILIDSGEAGNKEVILSYLSLVGTDELDYVIATHPHSDHIGSFPEIFEEVDVENVILSPLTDKNKPNTDEYEAFMESVASEGAHLLEATPREVIQLDELTLTVFAPLYQSDNLNNMSIVIQLTFGDTSFLFTGDAEFEEEQSLISPEINLDCDVLKVGHHGSDTSSSFQFVKRASPEIAVISCGKNNAYGHPHKQTLNALEILNADVKRTDEEGTIIIGTDGKDLRIF